MNLEEMDKTLDLAKEAAKKIYDLQVAALKNKYIAIEQSIGKESGGDK